MRPGGNRVTSRPDGVSRLIARLNHGAETRAPFPSRSRPARRPQVHSSAGVEADAFLFQSLALDVRPEAVAMRAPSSGIDHAVPRHALDERSAQGAERDADGTCTARLPENRRDLPVRHHLAAGDAADETIDEAIEGRLIGACSRARAAVAARSRLDVNTVRTVQARRRAAATTRARRIRQRTSGRSAPRARR